MLIYDVVVKLAGVLLNEAARSHRVGKGILNTSPQESLEVLRNICTQLTRDDNRAQRQWQGHTSLPLQAEVGNKLQVLALIDKASLVDKYTAIIVATLDSLGNSAKKQRRATLNFRK